MAPIDALLIGENSVHLFDEKAPLIEAALGDDVAVERTTDMAAFEDLAGYDVVVDYVTDNSLTEAQVAGLTAFVRDGGGYLPIHPAADLTSYIDDEGEFRGRDEPVPEMRELIGGHFVGHPEQSTFGVRIVDGDHPVTAGVSDFEVYDEPYQLDVDEDRVDVLARMDHDELPEDYPVVWVHEVGSGRVCYSSLGHTDRALEHESHARILRNAVHWVADA
jgi:type 1 glutamine amidotransferase